MTAVRYNNLDALQALIEKTTLSVEEHDASGNRALDHAIRKSNYKAARVIIAHRRGVNSRRKDGMTALMLCALLKYSAERVNIANDLIYNGADVNLKNNNEETSGDIARRTGNKAMFDLIENIIRKANSPNEDGHLPVFIAMKNHNDESLELLKKHGADVLEAVNSLDRNGKTPLIIAIEESDERLFHQLIREGADPSKPDRVGRSCLFHSVMSDSVSMTQELLRLRVNPAVIDSKGDIALFFTPGKYHGKQLAKALIEASSPVNYQNHVARKGVTALMIAAAVNDIQVYRLLEHYKADPRIKDIQGKEAADYFQQRETSRNSNVFLKTTPRIEPKQSTRHYVSQFSLNAPLLGQVSLMSYNVLSPYLLATLNASLVNPAFEAQRWERFQEQMRDFMQANHIIALQELCGEWMKNLIPLMKKMEYSIVSGYSKERHQSSVAVLFPYRMYVKEFTRRIPIGANRIGVYVILRLGHARFAVVSAHLPSRVRGSLIRHHMRFLDKIHALSGKKEVPYVIAGDFNIKQKSLLYNIYTRTSGRIIDSFRDLTGRERGFTRVGVHKGVMTRNTLDYIFYSRTETPCSLESERVLEFETTEDYVPNGRFPSDHFPIGSVFFVLCV